MSGLVGIFHRDGRPADLAGVRMMIAAAASRGPDGARVWSGGGTAIGHQWLRTGRREQPDRQWLVDPGLRMVVALDGRLDNADEIAAACGHVPGSAPAGAAALVLSAYRRWGEDCAARLLGDFALAIWDGPRRRLYCARDVMGVRPFHYHVDERRFVWGSEMRQVLAAGIGRAPNEPMIAEYLACAISSRSETIYRHVMRLPAAHWMVVTADRVRLAKYWSLDPSHELRYGSDGEYDEHFRSIFSAAVADRSDDVGPIGASLSGGLDSSSVVGMACALGRPIEAFSLVFPDDPEADERAYIDDVVQMWRISGERLIAGAVDGPRAIETAKRRADTLDVPADLLGELMLDRMRARGVRVALTGAGGDYGLTGSFFHYADAIRARDWSGLLRQIRADRHSPDAGWSPGQVLAYGVRPLVPRAVRQAVGPLARRLGAVGGLPDWIDRRLAARTGLWDRLHPPDRPDAATSHCRRHVCEVFESGWASWFLERAERAASEHGVEQRHPFFDRRLVEFVVALPERQRRRGELTKVVMRRALRQVLPDSVCARTDKADFTALVVAAIEQVGNARLDSLAIAQLGWVNQQRIGAMYREVRRHAARGERGPTRHVFPLWFVLAVDDWYRTSFGSARRDDEPTGAGWVEGGDRIGEAIEADGWRAAHIG